MVVDSSKFHSPVPFIIQLRRLIFGKTTPDAQTRVVFLINLVITLLFIVWNVFGAIAIGSKDYIRQKKGIILEDIITERADSLGFNSSVELLERLYTYYTLSAICWGIVFLGLILLYRKKKLFLHFTLTGFCLYLLLTVFYVGFDFFMTDITGFDKICLLIFISTILIQNYLLKRERQGESTDFFGDLDTPE